MGAPQSVRHEDTIDQERIESSVGLLDSGYDRSNLTITTDRYTSKEYAGRERELIWMHTWQAAGREDELIPYLRSILCTRSRRRQPDSRVRQCLPAPGQCVMPGRTGAQRSALYLSVPSMVVRV